jgi:PAS domain S-box-containing protein
MDEKKKILILEDETLVALSIKKCLLHLGYEVIGIAASGEQALSLIEKHQPDLALLDIKINGDIDGIQTAVKIKTTYHIPYIYLTAHTDADTLERAKETEPYGYVVKPVVLRNLHTAIEIALSKHDAEEALRQSEERYRTLVEGAGQPIFTLDKSGYIRFLNRIAEEQFFPNSKSAQGKFLRDVLPEAITAPMLDNLKKTTTSKTSFNYESCYSENDQENWYHISIHPLKDKNGQVQAAIVIATDITKQKKNEKDRIRLTKAVDQAGECIIITDINRKIQYVNPAFEKITGYNCTDVIGKSPNILKSGKHTVQFYTDLKKTISSGETWKGLFVNKKKDGSLYESEATISPVKDKSENIINYVAVERDVTEERKLQKQLQKAQKLEAIGRLAGGIAHDFNNIIGIISANVQLIQLNIPKDTKLNDELEHILQASNRAAELVNKIFAFSRGSKESQKRVALESIVDEALQMLESSLPSNIKLKKEINTHNSYIMANPVEIHQVILNLFTNSVHAVTKKGGELGISLDQIEPDQPIKNIYPECKSGPYVNLKVSDTGYGMDEETMEKIFDPFYTTKEPGEGTGMGLAVVHGIVKNHQGIIKVDSKVNVGTTFSIFFPLMDGTNHIGNPPEN